LGWVGGVGGRGLGGRVGGGGGVVGGGGGVGGVGGGGGGVVWGGGCGGGGCGWRGGSGFFCLVFVVRECGEFSLLGSTIEREPREGPSPSSWVTHSASVDAYAFYPCA